MTKKTDKPDDNINTQTAKELDADNKARVKASDKANAATLKVNEAADKQGGADVSHTEHAMGQRQDEGDAYEGMREQPPLAGRDIPQMLIVAENDTPTPGEDGKTPSIGVTREEAQRAAYIDTPEHHAKKDQK